MPTRTRRQLEKKRHEKEQQERIKKHVCSGKGCKKQIGTPHARFVRQGLGEQPKYYCSLLCMDVKIPVASASPKAQGPMRPLHEGQEGIARRFSAGK